MWCRRGSVALPILDAANHVRLGVGHHRQLNDAVYDGVQGEEVVALDNHNHRWPAEQCVRSDDPVQAADGLNGRARAGIGRGDKHERFHGHPRTVDEGTDSQREFAEQHDETRTRQLRASTGALDAGSRRWVVFGAGLVRSGR